MTALLARLDPRGVIASGLLTSAPEHRVTAITRDREQPCAQVDLLVRGDQIVVRGQERILHSLGCGQVAQRVADRRAAGRWRMAQVRNTEHAIRLLASLLLCAFALTSDAATVAGTLQDISIQALNTKLTFAPTNLVLATATGLSAGPPKTIDTANGQFSTNSAHLFVYLGTQPPADNNSFIGAFSDSGGNYRAYVKRSGSSLTASGLNNDSSAPNLGASGDFRGPVLASRTDATHTFVALRSATSGNDSTAAARTPDSSIYVLGVSSDAGCRSREEFRGPPSFACLVAKPGDAAAAWMPRASAALAPRRGRTRSAMQGPALNHLSRSLRGHGRF